jgi:hypothetical protein
VYDNTESGLAAMTVQTALDELSSGSGDAENIDYDNTESELTATNVQAAIDELVTEIGNIDLSADSITYDNTVTNRLTATDVQAALDEMVDFFTATVGGANDSSDWTGSGPYVATLTVSGIKATDRPIVSLDISNETVENGTFLQKVWNLVYRVEASADDEIKLYATGEPYPDLDIFIKVTR